MKKALEATAFQRIYSSAPRPMVVPRTRAGSLVQRLVWCNVLFADREQRLEQILKRYHDSDIRHGELLAAVVDALLSCQLLDVAFTERWVQGLIEESKRHLLRERKTRKRVGSATSSRTHATSFVPRLEDGDEEPQSRASQLCAVACMANSTFAFWIKNDKIDCLRSLEQGVQYSGGSIDASNLPDSVIQFLKSLVADPHVHPHER
ncbi:unnamed protein product, partial [Amoebophrya sp. A120]|eukprot:GSA120T00016973001.1